MSSPSRIAYASVGRYCMPVMGRYNAGDIFYICLPLISPRDVWPLIMLGVSICSLLIVHH